MPDGYVGPNVAGPIHSPKQWLARYAIPVREVPTSELKAKDAAALFSHCSRGGEHVDAEVLIPLGSDLDNPQMRWYIWHEVGHAADFVFTREGMLIATPHGQFSTNHIDILRKHQEAIISWTPHSDREYKTQPAELWAEAVACAVCEPGKMPPELLAALRSDLEKRNFPIEPAESADGLATRGHQALAALRGFISKQQEEAVRIAMRGEERDFFFQKMIEMAGIITAMPKTGETGGQGMEARAQLHYFIGSCDWYITEKDVGDQGDGPEHFQSQAFGWARLAPGCGECGYISIREIIEGGAELDFHFTPKPLSELTKDE